ncbi:Wzz/FepE/Etk N-terminal domain-containing protein [Escherichia coli]
MSSLNIKQGSDAHFPDYPLASPSNNEIDLLNLISVLWRAKKTVMAVVFAFACAGLLISFILPQKWTSAAVVTCNQVNHLIPTRVLVKGGEITCKILK